MTNVSVDKTEELAARVALLTTLVEQLEQRLDRVDRQTGTPRRADGTRSRRQMLKMAGVAAAGAAGAAALRILPASAATGQGMTLGMPNDAGSTTALAPTFASNPSPMLKVTGGAGSTAVYGQSFRGTAVSANDVNGGTALVAAAIGGGQGAVILSDSGSAIRVSSGSGLAIEALGSGRIMQTPHGTAGGAPADFTPNNFEQARDSNGVLWLSGLGPAAAPYNGWAPAQPGGANNAIFSAGSTQQYRLSSSDAITWVDLDPTLLKLTITPAFNSRAILYANADMWTVLPGYNQDLAIAVNGSVVAWKESGGRAAFAPNAVFVHTVYADFLKGTTYVVKLQWKTNRPLHESDGGIFVGAGLPTSGFSPTRLSVQLIAI